MTPYVLAVLLTLPAPTILRVGQTQSLEVLPSGSPLTVAWGPSASDQAGTMNYRMWCASPATPITQRVILKNFSQAELTRVPAAGATPAEIRATVAGIKDGAYACHITAWYDLSGTVLESDPSPSISFAFGSKPGPPTNFRRIVEQIKALLDELTTEFERR